MLPIYYRRFDFCFLAIQASLQDSYLDLENFFKNSYCLFITYRDLDSVFFFFAMLASQQDSKRTWEIFQKIYTSYL